MGAPSCARTQAASGRGSGRGLQSSMSWESLKERLPRKNLQETPSLHVRHAAKFAFRGAQRSSETLFGDGMAVDEIFDPRFLSSDARSY